MTGSRFSFADLFAGCGGLSHGFSQSDRFRGALAVDWWEQAGLNYKANFAEIPFSQRDLFEKSEVDAVKKELRNSCDILLGGPPCQGFSTLGKRRDGDRRSMLAEVFIDIAKSTKPAAIIIENVKGITSKRYDSAKTFSERLSDLLSGRARRASYDIRPIMLDATKYGMAQTRVRWVLVAVRRDVAQGNVLDRIVQSIRAQETPARKVLRDVIGDLPRIESGGGADEIVNVRGHQQQSIFNHRAMNHSSKLCEAFSYVPAGGGLLDVPRHLLTPHLLRMVEGSYGSGGHVKNIYGRLEWEKPSGTIVAGIDKITCGRFVHPESNRLLTPRECARLQSFPDHFRFYGSLVTQYYLIGNAVPPRLSEVLAHAISEGIETRQVKKATLSPETRSYQRKSQEFAGASV